MQIERQITRTRYQTDIFFLSTPKGKKEHQGKAIFSILISEASAQSFFVERREAFEILRKIRREKQWRLKYA
jgi:hypothetical protein